MSVLRQSTFTRLLTVLAGVSGTGLLVLGFVLSSQLQRLPLSQPQLELANLQLWRVFGVGLGVLAISLWVLTAWFHSSFIRPLREITRMADRMARGDFEQPKIAVNSRTLGGLLSSFASLARSQRERLQELTAAKAQLEIVISNTVSGILLMDQRGTVLLSNPAAMRMLGFADDELPRNHWQLTRNPGISSGLEQALKQLEPFKQEISISYPSERLVELNVVPLPSQNRYVAVFYDISQAQKLAAIRADLVANVSHELKTPVTSIHGFAETLLQGAIDDPAARQRFIQIIYRESARLLRLVSDLLDLSRLELDPQALEKRQINLATTVEEAVDRASYKAESKGIALRTAIGVEKAEMCGDEHRLGQAIGNLLDNGIKYTPSGGEVRVSLQYDKGAYIISVRDTGIGIESEHLERVFGRFYRTDKARSRQHGGTGLGLAIVKHIVELHGGQAWAESELGQGSIFHLRLPVGDCRSSGE